MYTRWDLSGSPAAPQLGERLEGAESVPIDGGSGLGSRHVATGHQVEGIGGGTCADDGWNIPFLVLRCERCGLR